MLRQRYSLALCTLILCSLAGMAISVYLTYVHYVQESGSFCDVSDYVNCDVVNQSEYAELFGIPVAILGFLAYTTLFISSLALFLSWRLDKITPLLETKNFLTMVTVFSGCGLVFSFYLTYIEFFVLETLCLLCFIQQILIFTIFLILLAIWLKYRKLATY